MPDLPLEADPRWLAGYAAARAQAAALARLHEHELRRMAVDNAMLDPARQGGALGLAGDQHGPEGRRLPRRRGHRRRDRGNAASIDTPLINTALAAGHGEGYLAGMDTAPSPAGSIDTLRPETEAERQDRLAWEAEGIAEARAELDAGLYVDIADVRAWVDSLRTDTPLPLPPIRHS